jgi:hypothetical protein
VRLNRKDISIIIPALVDLTRPASPNGYVLPKWIQMGMNNYLRYFGFDQAVPQLMIDNLTNYDDTPIQAATFLNWIQLTYVPNLIYKLNLMQ